MDIECEDGDDELERILQQTIPLSVQIKPTSPTTQVSRSNLENESSSTMAAEKIAEKKSEPAVPDSATNKSKHDAAKSPPQKKARILSLDDLLQRKRPVRYFIMKCADKTNLATALAKDIWSTQVQNEKILMAAYNANEVVLLFSVNQSGAYQGYARMVSGIGGSSEHVWEQGKYGHLFSIECSRMTVKEVNFMKCAHLRNPLNENKPVKICRDGQEVPGDVAYALCKIIDGGAEYDLSCENLSKRVALPASQSTTTTTKNANNARGGTRDGARDGRYSGRATGFEDNSDRSYNNSSSSYSSGSSYSRSAHSDYPPPRSNSYEPNRYPTDRSPPHYPSYAGPSNGGGSSHYYDRGNYSNSSQQAYYRGPGLDTRNGSKYLPPLSSADSRRGEPYQTRTTTRRDDRQGPPY